MNENTTAQELWELYAEGWSEQNVDVGSWDMLNDEEQRAWVLFAEKFLKQRNQK